MTVRSSEIQLVGNVHYQDTGCEIWMKCSLCPLDVCIDEIGMVEKNRKWVRMMANFAHDRIITHCDLYLRMVDALINLKQG